MSSLISAAFTTRLSCFLALERVVERRTGWRTDRHTLSCESRLNIKIKECLKASRSRLLLLSPFKGLSISSSRAYYCQLQYFCFESSLPIFVRINQIAFLSDFSPHVTSSCLCLDIEFEFDFFSSKSVLVACTRLNNPLCRSGRLFVGNKVWFITFWAAASIGD